MHGLYHQPVHMDALAVELRSRGFTVQVPRLHRGSLAGDTAAVQRAVDRCAGPPIVVGHSYGGAVIGGLEGVMRLVYVAAFVPDLDESCSSLGGPDALINSWVRPHPSGGTFVPGDVAPALFFADCPSGVRAAAARNLVPQAGGHGRGVPMRAAWKGVDTLYVVCEQDQALDPALQAAMAARCSRTVRLAASHSPYISMPGALARLIAEPA